MQSCLLMIVVLALAPTQVRMPSEEMSFTQRQGAVIEILGWEPTRQRIYYLVTETGDVNNPTDSLRQLRYFDTSDSMAQVPRTALWVSKSKSLPSMASRLNVQLDSLRGRLVAMRPAPLPPSVTIHGQNEHLAHFKGWVDAVADYRVEYQGLTGMSENFASDTLVIRRIFLAPNGRDAIAIVEQPSAPFEGAIVLLLSKLPHLSRRREQTP